MKRKNLEKFAALLENWKDCSRCPIGEIATKKAFFRGSINAKVVFVGEGPGRSEDVLGQPFVGRAGRLLDMAIRRAGVDPGDCFFTNLVACRPADKRGGPNRAPTEVEAANCSGRLHSTLGIVAPKCVVWLGRVPQEHAPKFLDAVESKTVLTFYLPHPAWILRCGGEKSDQYKAFVLRLKEVFKYGT